MLAAHEPVAEPTQPVRKDAHTDEQADMSRAPEVVDPAADVGTARAVPHPHGVYNSTAHSRTTRRAAVFVFTKMFTAG